MGFWCLNMANWVRYPLRLFWAFPPWRACEVEVRYPPQMGYLSDTCAIPYENEANGCDTPLCDTNSKAIARYGGVSRTRPLSPGTKLLMCVGVWWLVSLLSVCKDHKLLDRHSTVTTALLLSFREGSSEDLDMKVATAAYRTWVAS